MTAGSRDARNVERGGCSRPLLSVLSSIAAALPFVIWAVMQIPGEDWWGGAAFVYAPKWPWIALPIAGLIFAMIAGRPRLRLLNIISGAFALLVLAGFQINNQPPLPEDQPTIRVATWNVYGWTTERELVRERIMSWDCDVVCLQEAGGRVFADLLPGYDSVESGDLRTFVRGRILSTEAPRDLPIGPARMMITEVETDAGPFTVFNVHMPRTATAASVPRSLGPLIEYIKKGVAVREQLFPLLLNRLPEDRPVIVAGDMNTPPASRYYRRLAARLTDSFGTVGRGFGYTFVWRRKFPSLRIDYVWTGGGMEPLRSETKHSRPSDHRPVVSTVALPAASTAEKP